MNPVLAQVYQLDKTASAEDGDVTLDNISAADLLAAHAAGEVDINEFFNFEDSEKTAGIEDIDLSEFSTEELAQALSELDETEKIASEEGEYWDAAGRQMARGYADELTKQASMETNMDLNELSAEEIIGLAYELADEMDKTAAAYGEEDEIDLNELTPDEIIEFAYFLENGGEVEKTAGAFDLNDLSVDEFIGLAAELEEEMEMEKEANIMLARASGVPKTAIRRMMKQQSKINRPNRKIPKGKEGAELRKMRAAQRKGRVGIREQRKIEAAARKKLSLRGRMGRFTGSGGAKELFKARGKEMAGAGLALGVGGGYAAGRR